MALRFAQAGPYRMRGRRLNGLAAARYKLAKNRARVLPDDVTIHDVRRTVADALLNRIGRPPRIVDHVSQPETSATRR